MSVIQHKTNLATEFWNSILFIFILQLKKIKRTKSRLKRKIKCYKVKAKDDRTIIIKSADKGSVVVVWDREDYLKEAYRQLNDKEVYEQVPDDPSVLAKTLMNALEKVRLRGDLSKDTLEYFLVKDSNFCKILFAA